MNIADAIAGGVTASVDLGKVNERYFCTVATLGADAEVTDYVDRMRMPLTGTPAYVYGAVRVLLRYRNKAVRLSGDFGVIEKSVFVASTANTSSYGGGIPIAPMASPTDGMLDLCLIDAVRRVRSLWLLPKVFRGAHARLPVVHFIRTAGFRLESDEPLEVWADGERVAATPLSISVVRGAIRVLVGAGAAVSGCGADRTLRV
jgi:diacylglycerol kinase (ATP)